MDRPTLQDHICAMVASARSEAEEKSDFSLRNETVSVRFSVTPDWKVSGTVRFINCRGQMIDVYVL